MPYAWVCLITACSVKHVRVFTNGHMLLLPTLLISCIGWKDTVRWWIKECGGWGDIRFPIRHDTANRRGVWLLMTYNIHNHSLILYVCITCSSSHMQELQQLRKRFPAWHTTNGASHLSSPRWSEKRTMRLLFVWCESCDTGFLLDSFVTRYSDNRTKSRTLEEAAILNWLEYVTECSGTFLVTTKHNIKSKPSAL